MMTQSFVNYLFATLVTLLGFIGCWLVITKRVRMLLSIEVGTGLISLGLLAVGISSFELGAFCPPTAEMLKVLMIGGGVVIIGLSARVLQKRTHHPTRRRTDLLKFPQQERRQHPRP